MITGLLSGAVVLLLNDKLMLQQLVVFMFQTRNIDIRDDGVGGRKRVHHLLFPGTVVGKPLSWTNIFQ